MPMVKAMGFVLANPPPVVSGMKVVIDIGEVVARNPPLVINPYFPPQAPISTLVGNLVRFVVNFYLRHDSSYHP